jgi:hypothetical protein
VDRGGIVHQKIQSAALPHHPFEQRANGVVVAVVDPNGNAAVARIGDRPARQVDPPPGRAQRGRDAASGATTRPGHHGDGLFVFGHPDDATRGYGESPR